jgi:2-oxoglutarate dehydrogenase E2 component (dihydrolipoamide succinyltransferase)
MAIQSVVLPQLGESVAEATLSKWLVNEGDWVERDQTLAEVSTDKADTELPSPSAGRVARRLVAEGQTVPVNAPILELEIQAAAAAPTAPPVVAPAPAPAPVHAEGPAGRAHEEPRSSPLVRRIAREKGVDLAEISGTGAGGRVTKGDILAYLSRRPSGPIPPPPLRAPQPQRPAPAPRELRETPPPAASPAGPEYKPPEYRPLPGDEIVPFSRRRSLIAQHMAYSKRVAPHVPCMAEVAMHRVESARRRAAERGEKVSALAHVAVALAQAVREVPAINATVLEGAYAVHRQVNLGIAVETEEGLVVPVIAKADELSLVGMTRAIAERAERARAGKLGADDFAGGTITLSNPGPRGNTWGAAIIHQPQVAIVRMGEIIKRPVVISVEDEDAIVIRPVMTLTLSYDHRIVDGAAANHFLRRIKERLEAAST